ncbi:hypothetical protein BH09ACT1_BH09ACT1_13470 [soil metagenome]
MKQPSNRSPWVAAVFIAVGGALEGVRLFFEPVNGDTLFAAGLALLGVGLILSGAGLLNYLRVRRLTRGAAAGAIVFDFVAYRELPPQLNRLADSLGVPHPNIRIPSSGAAVLDAKALKLYKGTLSPIEYLAIPTVNLKATSIAKVRQDKWTLKTLEFVFSNAESEMSLNFCVVRAGFPGVMSGKALALLQAGVAQIATRTAHR